ncbi:MAG: hypothetical protein IPL43_00105, partial [Micropruina sp.]|nr:hypothetical protein [Micropruina sp.]
MTFTLMDIFSVLGVSLSAAFLMLSLRSLREAQRSAHRRSEQMRVEIDSMRRHYEEEIYATTRRLLKSEGRWADVNHLLLSAQRSASSESEIPGQSGSNSADPESRVPEFLRENGLAMNDMEVDPTLVFVLTPFSDQFRQEFEVMRMVCSAVGLRAMRGDEENHQGDIFPHILRLIARSRIIIANLSGRNPNVLYELGICHALAKTVIMVTSELEDVPFDL